MMAQQSPLKPGLGFYRKLAKNLKRVLAQGNARALERLSKVRGAAAPSADEPVASDPRPNPSTTKPASAFEFREPESGAGVEISLAEAQRVIANEHGYATWAKLKQAVEQGLLDPSKSGSARLFAAVRGGDSDAVGELLKEDAQLCRAPDPKGRMPLVEACERGFRQIARILLDAGANVSPEAFLAAAHAGPHKSEPALDVVELLLQRGVPYDVFAQATLGRVDDLEGSLAGIDLEARGPTNATPLFLAAWNAQPAAVKMLLEAGAEPNPVCREGQSAWDVVFLHAAWSERHRAVARLLLDHGVTCSLHEACILEHLPTVKRLLREDSSIVDKPGPDGKTPLTSALISANRDLCEVLLAAGAYDPQGQGRALVDAERYSGGFDGRLYQNASFERTIFNDVNLGHATLANVNLKGVRFDNVNLSDARIDNAVIRGMTIFGVEVAPLITKELARRRAEKSE
jgi:ankyrin repeat protein